MGSNDHGIDPQREDRKRRRHLAAATVLEAALGYARQGTPVFPLKPQTKVPLTERGFKDATTDERQIRKWWKRHPHANIGLPTGPTSGLLVVDLDGEKGRASLERLERERGHLPTTHQVETGGGGAHLYFRYPSEGDVRNSAGTVGVGVDVRGEGGYVVAPPSIHERGRRYEVAQSVEPADPPEWLLDLLQNPPEKALHDDDGPIPQGERNDTLMRLAGKLRRQSLSRNEIEAALRGVNVSRCRPPLDDDEVATIAASAARYERGKTAEPPAAVPEFRPFPVDCLPGPARDLAVRGARAHQSDPAMIAPCALAAMAAAIGNSRTVELREGWQEPSILWAVVVAPSGTVKSPALDLAKEPAEVRDNKSFHDYRERMKEYDPDGGEEKPRCERFLVDDLTIEALGAILADSPRGLLLARDELASWLGSFTRYATTMRTGAEEARWLSMHRAQPLRVDRRTSEPLRVSRAAVSLVGMIQPGVMRAALCNTDFDSGLVARMLLVLPPIPTRKWRENAGLPATITDRFGRMTAKLYGLDLPVDEYGAPQPRPVRLDGEAAAAWAAYYDEINERMAVADDRTRAALSKLEGGAARLALVVHLGRWASREDVDPNRIDGESMRRGIELARWFAREAERVYAVLAESDENRELRELIELIERNGGSASARDLTRWSRRYRSPGRAKEALGLVVSGGRGEWYQPPADPKGGGQPGKRLRLLRNGDGDTTPNPCGATGGSVTVTGVTIPARTYEEYEQLRAYLARKRRERGWLDDWWKEWKRKRRAGS